MPSNTRLLAAALCAALLCLSMLPGCAARREVIVDRQGIDAAQYQRDLAECEAYASEVATGRKVGGGAVAGAVIGGAIGAIVGDHNTAERLAGVGAVSGTAKGAGAAATEKRTVVRSCLLGRGYKVLN